MTDTHTAPFTLPAATGFKIVAFATHNLNFDPALTEFEAGWEGTFAVYPGRIVLGLAWSLTSTAAVTMSLDYGVPDGKRPIDFCSISAIAPGADFDGAPPVVATIGMGAGDTMTPAPLTVAAPDYRGLAVAAIGRRSAQVDGWPADTDNNTYSAAGEGAPLGWYTEHLGGKLIEPNLTWMPGAMSHDGNEYAEYLTITTAWPAGFSSTPDSPAQLDDVTITNAVTTTPGTLTIDLPSATGHKVVAFNLNSSNYTSSLTFPAGWDFVTAYASSSFTVFGWTTTENSDSSIDVTFAAGGNAWAVVLSALAPGADFSTDPPVTGTATGFATSLTPATLSSLGGVDDYRGMLVMGVAPETTPFDTWPAGTDNQDTALRPGGVSGPLIGWYTEALIAPDDYTPALMAGSGVTIYCGAITAAWKLP